MLHVKRISDGKPHPVEARRVSNLTLEGCTGQHSSPHSPYITSSCPSTILNCCVHPASSLTLSVISLAAPGEGY